MVKSQTGIEWTTKNNTIEQLQWELLDVQEHKKESFTVFRGDPAPHVKNRLELEQLAFS